MAHFKDLVFVYAFSKGSAALAHFHELVCVYAFSEGSAAVGTFPGFCIFATLPDGRHKRAPSTLQKSFKGDDCEMQSNHGAT